MSGVEVYPLDKLGEDERGATFSFRPNEGEEFLYVFRKAGSVSGNHYHEGRTYGTKNKAYILINGTVDISWRNKDAKEVTTNRVEAPARVEIAPNTVHAVVGVTDFYLIEMLGLKDLQQDRILAKL